ncbi:hypothetical protein GPAL_3451 [Glaciecola pallidula DSM 14239 = ACAM 615]|uniref:Uncharacterized protein n=1 Tax=Brumicola pallidula DSM 14239 = ACAM 615 TaxID=1121922 RepID=K6YC66_9ALTE|nr:hypothetical protein GPAL_3451 [Glaciecola pallidula DSM 14239 = ACAM 615]
MKLAHCLEKDCHRENMMNWSNEINLTTLNANSVIPATVLE